MNKAILTAAVVGLTTAMMSIPAFAYDSSTPPNTMSPRPSTGHGGNGNGGNTQRPTPRPNTSNGPGPHS